MDNADQIEQLKKLVKETQAEVKKDKELTKGTCINPKRTFFGKRIAEHKWTKWGFRSRTNIYSEAGHAMPVRTEDTYWRVCNLCGDVETKRVSI